MTATLFTFENLYRAWLDCRRRKRGRKAALAFEARAEEELLALASELAGRTYRPRPSFCFVARNDKYREVFAAQFRDRVVHHLLVRELEKIWEPVFIHDSYACRAGKGTHAAVWRLQTFLRRATANGTRRAWFAQLDVRSFFPSIDRRFLLGLLHGRLADEELRWLTEVLVLHDPSADPVVTCSPEKWRRIGPGKSLFGAPPGQGLPIGNFTSQFFANVYLNPLDQFVKHALRSRYYVRYVDDLVLVHEDRAVLEDWRDRIEHFLRERLSLELHPARRVIRPVSNGADFLGYVVRPSHLLVRRRIVDRCKAALDRHRRRLLGSRHGGQTALVFPPPSYEKLNATVQSYFGLFSHASSRRLRQALFERRPWLGFLLEAKGPAVRRRWVLHRMGAFSLKGQVAFFRSRFRGAVLFQVGRYFELFDRDARRASRDLGLRLTRPRPRFYARCGVHRSRGWELAVRLTARGRVLVVAQTGRTRGRLRERVGVACLSRTPAARRTAGGAFQGRTGFDRRVAVDVLRLRAPAEGAR